MFLNHTITPIAVNKPGQLGALRKSGSLNPLTVQAKQEHSLVCETIEEIMGPRLMTEVCFFTESKMLASLFEQELAKKCYSELQLLVVIL